MEETPDYNGGKRDNRLTDNVYIITSIVFSSKLEMLSSAVSRTDTHKGG